MVEWKKLQTTKSIYLSQEKKWLVQQHLPYLFGSHSSTSFHSLLLTTKKERSKKKHICSHSLHPKVHANQSDD